jgi:hypothetical protein
VQTFIVNAKRYRKKYDYNIIMTSNLFLPTTNYLIDFLDTHISHKLDCFQPTKFSPTSKKFLEELFEKMIKAEESFSKTKIIEQIGSICGDYVSTDYREESLEEAIYASNPYMDILFIKT